MQQKTEQINLRTTQDEKKALQLKATERGFKNLSEFILTSIIKPERLNTKKLMSFLYELNKIGVNLNQITRKLHQDDTANIDILKEINCIKDELTNLVKAVNNVN